MNGIKIVHMAEFHAAPQSDTLLVWAMGRYDEDRFDGYRHLQSAVEGAGYDMRQIGMHDLPGMQSFDTGGVTTYFANYFPGNYLAKIDKAVSDSRELYKRIVLGGFSYGGMMVAYRQVAERIIGLSEVDGVILAMPNEFFHTGEPYSGVRDLQQYGHLALREPTYPTHHEPLVEYRSAASADPTTGDTRYVTPIDQIGRHTTPYRYMIPGKPINVVTTGLLRDDWLGLVKAPTSVIAARRDTINQNTEDVFSAIPAQNRRELVVIDTEHDLRDKENERQLFCEAVVDVLGQF